MSRIVDIEPLLKQLDKELKEFEGCTEVETFEESVEDAISELERLPVIDPKTLLRSQWISVKDKLPNEYQSVLGAVDGVWIRIVHYEPGGLWVEDTTDNEYKVTHWIPLEMLEVSNHEQENL